MLLRSLQLDFTHRIILALRLSSLIFLCTSILNAHSYNSFAIGNGSSTSPEESIYGLYQCRGDLKPNDCSKCVESSVNQMGLVCPYAHGASFQLEGYNLGYEHIDFFGKPDTSLRYRKCGKAVNNDFEFFKGRDDVLADLQAANEFRVSTSGFVEWFALCLGNSTAAYCSSCLADAMRKLKSLSGSATTALLEYKTEAGL